LLLPDKFKPLGITKYDAKQDPSSGSGATPSPSRTLAATTTPSASTSVGGIRNRAFVCLKIKAAMRKDRQRNPRNREFPFHLPDVAFRPVPFVANEAAK
jgi:hypothetical protein